MEKHYHSNRLSNAGRSMVEMLGVLAIIGVLSIGGLFGYKIAMTYHKANETIHDVMLRATNVPMKWEDYQQKGDNYLFSFADMGAYSVSNTMGYPVEVRAKGTAPSGETYAFRVEVDDVPADVCRRIHNMNPTAVDEIAPALANCADGTMTFYFDEDFSNVPPGINQDDCEADGDCGAGQCCNNGVCGACEESPASVCQCPDLGEKPCDEADIMTVKYTCQDGTQLEDCEDWNTAGCGECPSNLQTKRTGDCCSDVAKTDCCPDWENCECEPADDCECPVATIQKMAGECCDTIVDEACCPAWEDCGCTKATCPAVTDECESGCCEEYAGGEVCGTQCDGGFVDIEQIQVETGECCEGEKTLCCPANDNVCECQVKTCEDLFDPTDENRTFISEADYEDLIEEEQSCYETVSENVCGTTCSAYKKKVCPAVEGTTGQVDICGCPISCTCIYEEKPFSYEGESSFCTEHNRFLKLAVDGNKVSLLADNGWLPGDPEPDYVDALLIGLIHNYDDVRSPESAGFCRSFKAETLFEVNLSEQEDFNFILKMPFTVTLDGEGCNPGTYTLNTTNTWIKAGICPMMGAQICNVSYDIDGSYIVSYAVKDEITKERVSRCQILDENGKIKNECTSVLEDE